MDAHTASQIRVLLRQDIDWAYLLEIATQQNVTPLLCFNLRARFSEACPTIVLARLDALLRDDEAGHVFFSQELVRIAGIFEAHGIRVIPYKGPILTNQAFRQIVPRRFGDLDVLIHKWDHHRVTDVLHKRGWTLIVDFGWEMTFKHPSGWITLDVHEALTHTRMPLRVDFDQMWKRCVTLSILGKPVRTFAPNDLLIVLCVQLAKDIGEKPKPPLMKICDIAELIRDNQRIDWEWVSQEAGKLGALVILYLGVRTAADVFGIVLPKEIWEKSRAFPQMNSLITHVRERVLGGTNNRYSHPELLNESLWYTVIRERFRHKNRLARGLYRIFTTNSLDYSFVRLPRALFLLYYVVRPVRLVDNYGRKLLSQIHRNFRT